jgi:uncharacterized protein
MVAVLLLCAPGCRDRGAAHNPEVVTVQSDLPSPAEIAKLPPDGGAEFNRLIFESSPYLLQHARNPVDWWAWNEEALAAAKEQDKPIFLSVGYSTCHWCHVMEDECFEKEDVAAILNAEYIPIKVDREERPDLDAIYITATQVINGSAGWPNNVWLTPDGKPYFAATYLPADVLKQRLNSLADAYHYRSDDVLKVANEIAEVIASEHRVTAAAAGFEPSLQPLHRALELSERMYDPLYGGLGTKPKFPPHGTLHILAFELYRDGGHERWRKMFLNTLDKMAAGGIHDHLGGGFHRYSTDERWLLPHFEKMLYDNAQLGRAYVDAYLLTGEEKYKRVADGIYGWVLREMTDPQGGFYSAIDADSEGEEGKFYVWTLDEVVEVLGEADGQRFAAAYGVTKEGNYLDEASGVRTGASVVHIPRPKDSAATEPVAPEFADMRQRLLQARAKRVRPHTDDKVLVNWNGLMLNSLAYAGQQLNNPEYTRAAEKAAEFILSDMRQDGRLLHSWRVGQAKVDGYLDDYTHLADGLLELHAATSEARWLDEARTLMAEVNRHFRAEAGGYYYTSDTGPKTIVRRTDSTDDVTPSGNGMAARVLARLAALTGEQHYADEARAVLSAMAGTLKQVPVQTESLALASALIAEDAAAVSPTLGRGTSDASTNGPVTVRASLDTTASGPVVNLRLSLKDGFHVNPDQAEGVSGASAELVPTRLVIEAPDGLTIGEIRRPQVQRERLGNSELPVYLNGATYSIPLTVSGDKPRTLVLRLTTQPCDATACQLPQTHELRLVVPARR